MIVDDDRTTGSLLQTLLEIDGYEVVVVTRGMEVVAKAEAEPPDLILMDYHLNDIDGLEVLRTLRDHATLSETPVIMISGMNVEDKVRAAGANHFLVKPFEPAELPALFERYIKSP